MSRKNLSGWVRNGLVRTIISAAILLTGVAHAAAPLKIGYSDWPGWVAWQVAIDKGWFKQAGVAVDFEWFDYSASIDAFAAGKLDAVTMTNGDALVTGASGAKSVMLMLTDYSNGNDMIVAAPGIKSLKQLKGKKVAVEHGLVEHLLLLDGLKKAGMKQSDVTLVNAKTNSMPQVLASGEVAAVGAWQPVAGEAMRSLPGARPVYTSADEPGLIYDVLAVNPNSAREDRARWLKVLKVWDRVVHYINDPKTRADAVRIMAGRVGVSPQTYLPLLQGTKLLDLNAGRKIYQKGDGFSSLYGSSQVADDFNVANNVYAKHQDVSSYLDPSFTQAAQ